MRKSEDTTERVLAELYDNGAADDIDMLARKFVSTFNLNKNKMGTAQQLDKNDKIRYAYKARNPQTVTKSEFEHHYWVAANGILTKDELGFLNSAIGEMKKGTQYIKNADGFIWCLLAKMAY